MGDAEEFVPLSQGTSLRSYGWVILFTWQLNEENPFCVFPIRHFKASNFPIELITGPLSDQSRSNRYRLKNVPGSAHSVFCKIEKCKYYACYVILIKKC